MSDKPWGGGSFSHWPTIRRLDGYRLAQEKIGGIAIREVERELLRRELYHSLTPEMRRYLPPPEPMSADDFRILANHYLHTIGIPKEWVQAEPKEEDNTMNLRNAVYLIPDDLVTVIAAAGEGERKLTYLCEQGLAKQLSAALGDKKRPLVVVRTSSRARVIANLACELAEVLEVHAEPVIDMNYKGAYHYVVGLVDPSGILAREREDAKVYIMLKRKQQSSAREEVLAGLGIGDPKQFLEHVRGTVDAVESGDVTGGGDAAD